MAQILLDLFSDLSAFYPTFPFEDEASVRQPVHMHSVTGLSSWGKCRNPRTREEERHWPGQEERMDPRTLIPG